MLTFACREFKSAGLWSECIYGLLDELTGLSAAEGFMLDGAIELSGCVDDITLVVKDGCYRAVNSGLLHADTDSIIKELERRGVHMSSFAQDDGKRNWSITVCSSATSDIIHTEHVRGTEEQVKEYLASLVKKSYRKNASAWCGGTEKAKDVEVKDGVLTAFAEFWSCGSAYTLYYRAEPEKEPVLLAKKGKARKTKNRKQTWLLGSYSSEGDSVSFKRLIGTEYQVKKYMASLVRECRDEDPDAWEDGETSAKTIGREICGRSLVACAQFYGYHVAFSALPEDEAGLRILE